MDRTRPVATQMPVPRTSCPDHPAVDFFFDSAATDAVAAQARDGPGRIFMRLWPLCMFVGACLMFCVGCQPWHLAHRTLHEEKWAYSHKHDDRRSLKVYQSWANEAWLYELDHHPDPVFSRTYEKAFRVGFIDFVYAGGTGEPPPVPPRNFWGIRFRNTAGDDLLADWYAGFRHGAQSARDLGYRDRAIIPSATYGVSNQPTATKFSPADGPYDDFNETDPPMENTPYELLPGEVADPDYAIPHPSEELLEEGIAPLPDPNLPLKLPTPTDG